MNQADVPIRVHSGGPLDEPVTKSTGPLFFAAFAVLFFCGAYLMWPPDFFSTPMTTAAVLRAIATPALAILGLEFLFAFAITTLSDG